MTVPSCTLEPSPISMSSISPRRTQVGQTEALGPIRTEPITTAEDAT